MDLSHLSGYSEAMPCRNLLNLGASTSIPQEIRAYAQGE